METLKERVEWISMMHKQNLNGRETEDELFEAGIMAGIEETQERKDDVAIKFAEWLNKGKFYQYGNNWINPKERTDTEGFFIFYSSEELLQIFKKEKAL